MAIPHRTQKAIPLAILSALPFWSAPPCLAERPEIELELESWLRQYYRDAWVWARTTRSGRVFAAINLIHPGRAETSRDADALRILDDLRKEVLEPRSRDLDFADGTQVVLLGGVVSSGKERAETTRRVLHELSRELARIVTANGLVVRSLAIESLELGRVSVQLAVRGVELGELERERLEVGLWHTLQQLTGSARFGFRELDLELSSVTVEDLALAPDPPSS